MLYSAPTTAQTVTSDTIFLTTFSDSVSLGEVLVKGKKTLRANSRWSDMNPVDLVTVGGANGDLYQALQTLPGTQVQGESGRLLVRGGSSSETQTYIDGMHVLNPYTATGENTPARGRYSTFMFSGVNLATGGASQEYGEALSAVLPLETKDHSTVNKWGISPSTVGIGTGGTRAFAKGSLSVDMNYQNMAPYNRLFPGRLDFEKPYELFSGATQFRYTPDEQTVLKVYAGYDRTDFSYQADAANRLFALGEDNVYLNTTFRKRTAAGWNWFAGAAFSFYNQQVGSVSIGGDSWNERQQELHLKAKTMKQLSPWLKLDVGVESFLRRYESQYHLVAIDNRNKMNPTVEACFATATLYPLANLKTEISFRTEYTSLNRKVNFSPRLAVNYTWNDWMFSVTVGRYTQLPENRYLIQQPSLLSETCLQYNVGAQYEAVGRFYKVEGYYKKYNRLTLCTPVGLTSDGYGSSKGVDLFFCDPTLFKNVEYQLAYSFNLSRRKCQEYTELTMPQYATRHNASLVVKYSLPRLRTIIGLTDRFASGRPYHNPNRPGLMNDEVKPYHTLDLGITYLASKKVIVHASASNILGRKNEFGRIDGQPVLASSDHFFYLGVFITIGKKAAYDASNF